MEAQVRENGELAEKVRDIEEGVRECIGCAKDRDVVEVVREYVAQMNSKV